MLRPPSRAVSQTQVLKLASPSPAAAPASLAGLLQMAPPGPLRTALLGLVQTVLLRLVQTVLLRLVQMVMLGLVQMVMLGLLLAALRQCSP